MHTWLIVSALVALAVVSGIVLVVRSSDRQRRRPWRLTCPHAGMVAQIRIDPARGVLGRLLGRAPEVERCTLWPELHACQQECLALPAAARTRMRPGEAPPREHTPGVIRVIVVPLDGKPGSDQILTTVGELARGQGAMLRLLRVVPPVKEVRNDDDQVIAYVDQETARVVNEAYDYLRRLARPVEGVPIAETVRVGDDVLEIVEESEAVGADLIAIPGYRLSDRGPQPDSRLARRLQRATTIPVLVVSAAEPVAA